MGLPSPSLTAAFRDSHELMDPVIEEFGRVRQPDDIRPSKLREWQQYLKTTIQPQLDALAALQAEQSTKKARA